MIEHVNIIGWFKEPIKKSVDSVFEGANDFVESLDLLNKYKNIHFEQLRSTVRSIKILGMQSPMDLARLYYPAQVSTDIRRRIYRPEWAKLAGTARAGATPAGKSIEPGAKFVDANPRTVVLGGPGAGKTTFLKHLALAYIDVEVFQKTSLKASYFPAYLHLPSLPKEGLNILAVVAAHVQSRADSRASLFFERLAATGNLVVLLDSLDEVPAENRQAVVASVNEFASQYPLCRIVVSCRSADYQEVFEDFAEVEIARLTEPAVQAIVKAWFASDPECAERLLAMLAGDSTVSALTETPLLLSLLCIQYRNDLALPKRKTELYRRCVDALLRDWDASRNFRRDSKYSQLSDDRKEMIFSNVAGANSVGTLEFEFSEPKLLSTISDIVGRFGLSANDAKGILLEMESHHGIVEKCSAESFQFSHSTMHEYFAARHFVDTRQEITILKRHFGDEQWHTIITFMCAMLQDATPMLEFLVAQSSTESFKNYPTFGKRLSHLLLLYRCMTMGVAIAPSLRANICDHMISAQSHLMARLRADSILPYAARRPQGVRQTLMTYGKLRPRGSIDDILQPYRRLMNEIFMSPLPDYAERVLEYIPMIASREDSDIYSRIGLITCLISPLADAKPQQFLNTMFGASAELLKHGAESVRMIVVESLAIHKARHPKLEHVPTELPTWALFKQAKTATT